MENNTDSGNSSATSGEGATNLHGKVILITGAAHRIGAQTARMLHAQGANLVLHYHSSREAAQALQSELNDNSGQPA